MSIHKDDWDQVSDALYVILTAVITGLAVVASVFGFFLYTARNSKRTTHE